MAGSGHGVASTAGMQDSWVVSTPRYTGTKRRQTDRETAEDGKGMDRFSCLVVVAMHWAFAT